MGFQVLGPLEPENLVQAVRISIGIIPTRLAMALGMRNLRPFNRGIAVFIFFLVILVYIQGHQGSQGVYIKRNGLRPLDKEAGRSCLPQLHDEGLKGNVLLSRRCITPVWVANTGRDAVANISGDPLITKPTLVNLSDCHRGTLDAVACEPLQLEVPPPFPPEKYPEFLFGVATTHDRLYESMGTWKHWLSDSEARIVAVVTDRQYAEDDQERIDVENLLAEEGIDITLVSRHGDESDRARQQFLLLRDMARLVNSRTRWIGIVDDDTFFPSLWPIRKSLSAYDPSKPLYLGSLSEDMNAVMRWGFMGFGGAGVFLSAPLLQALQPWLDTCNRDSDTPQGDVLLKQCIYNHTDSSFKVIPRLYQQDLEGDYGGFYEAGLNPLSLHHWKSWHHVPIADMARVGAICGECFLQRWQFGGNTVLANGYSVNVYADEVLDDLKLDLAEGTWETADDGTDRWEPSLGRLRRKIEDKYRKRFLLVNAEWVDGHTLKQTYVWRANNGSTTAEKTAEDKDTEQMRGRRRKQGGKSKRESEPQKNMKVDRKLDEVLELLWMV